MNRREQKQIEAKRREWDRANSKFWHGVSLWYKFIMKRMNGFLDWNFLYQPRNKKDRTNHIWAVALLDIFIILTFWAWLRLVLVR